MATSIADAFIAELRRAIARESRVLVGERFAGLPSDTVVALKRVTNDEPDLVPNADGEFLRAA